MFWQLYEAASPSGKRYLGITSKTLKGRIKSHRDAVRSGSMIPFHRAIRYYGDAITWRTLVIGDRDYILDLEAKAIEAFKTRDKRIGYNISLGGEASPSLVPETAAKISASKKGRKGRKLSETELKMLRERIADPELQARRIAAIKAKWADPDFRAARSAKMKERWATQEFREKMEARDEATRAKMTDPAFKAKMKTWRHPSADPAWRKARSDQMKDLNADPEFAAARSKRQSEQWKRLHADPIWEAKNRKRATAYFQSEAGRKASSDRMKARHSSNDPSERAKLPYSK